MNSEIEELESTQETPTQHTHSAGRAALCGLIPGLGAVYNRQYQKAVIHFAVFAGLWQLAGEIGLFVMATIVFYLFTIIDAYRSAEVIARVEPTEMSEIQGELENLPLWGGFLVLIGVIFLLDSLDWIQLSEITRIWPVLFIAFGVYLIYTWKRQDTGSAQPEASRRRSDSTRDEARGVE